MGTTGTDGVIAIIVGATPIVGTAAAELTPRLLISVESKGIPARGAPPDVVGVVGVEDAATLFEPEPHIPDIPEVSIIPEGVDIPEVAEIPADVLADKAVLPAIAPVAGTEPATDVPPPSKLVLDPYICDDPLPSVEHVVVAPGIAIVPVGLGGSGLVPADVISVAPRGIPVGPIGCPDTLLSGEVAPIMGVGSTVPPTCATAVLQRRSAVRATGMRNSLTDILRFQPSERNLNLSTSWIGGLRLCTNSGLLKNCPAHGQATSSRLTTIGVGVLRTTTHRNACTFEGLISMCGRKAGT